MNDPSVSTGSLQQFVERARRLYSLPAVAMQVLELTNHPKVDTRALKECIENDPALTTKILRVVNSSLFGLSREVTDLNQALALLGTKPLKLLVLGFSLPKELFANVEAEVLTQYWRHTLTKAVAARELCDTIWKQPGDEAFIAGLLQDVGILALVQDLGPTYVQFLNSVQSEGANLLELETAALGFDHAVLSARLLDHWKLPESLVQVVGMPQDVERLLALPEDQQMLPQVLHLAELLSTLLTQQREETLPELLELGRRYRQISLEQLQALVSNLQEKVSQLAEVLSLQLADEVDYCDVLLQAHAQLSDVAGEVAASFPADTSQEEALLKETQALSNAMAEFTRVSSLPPGTTPHAATGIKPPTAWSSQPPAAPNSVPQTDAKANDRGTLSADPGLVGRVSATVSACRQARCALSLVLIELDDFADMIFTHGREGAIQVTELLEGSIAAACEQGDVRQQIDESLFAVILEDCDRQQAARWGKHFISEVQNSSPHWPQLGGASATVSVGVASLALPPRNFPPQDLIDAAQRCLNGARASGGNVLKSIDIY